MRKHLGRLAVAALALSFLALPATSASAATAGPETAHLAAAAPAAAPSYYLTPAGRRLTPAQVAANSSLAATAVPVYFVTADLESYGHACANIGNYKGVDAIECADLLAQSDGNGGALVYPQLEAYCQGSGALPQCAGADVNAQLAKFVSGTGTPVERMEFLCGKPNATAGPSYGACANGTRNVILGFASTYDVAGCDTSPGGNNEFWTTVVAATTKITLPGDQPRIPASNLSSQHAILCG